jgi:signal transduction histidine kinase
MLANEALSTPRILLVDDTPTNLKVLADALRAQGWTTLMAINGVEAIEQIHYASPDLILLDVQMPEMDGFEVCRRLKADPTTQNIPIIFMTALSDQTDKVKGLELGAVDYITKPLQQDEAIARVRLHLQLSHLTKTLNQKIVQQAATEAQLQQLTQELEQRVQTRTAELTASLEQIRHMQIHLIQQEKTAALGQLTAGMAHEINNPINFIYANLPHVNEYAQHLLRIVALYQQGFPEGNVTIEQAIVDADLEFIVRDLPRLLHSMRSGADRIQSIIQSLRNFARLDEAEIKEVDLHEGLDNTLAILRSRLPSIESQTEIAIRKEYGNLPLVECYPGQLNQVFMHIINNAVDALHALGNQAAENPSWSPQILIRTQAQTDDRVSMTIHDNGIGMTEAIQAQLFDPFFTTKPIGQGTGLGLAISQYVITQQHFGQLRCDSAPGQGTTLTITLPTRLPIAITQEMNRLENFITPMHSGKSVSEHR